MIERESDRASDGNDADPASTRPGNLEETVMLGVFAIAQRILLILVVAMTAVAVAGELAQIVEARVVTLGDILLMFLYAEVIAMAAVFYSGRDIPLVYPLFVAITALARLIVLQGKDMDPTNIVLEAAAILIIAIAVVILLRFARQK